MTTRLPADVTEVTGTASMEATSGSPLNCALLRSDDVRDLTLTPPDGGPGTAVRAEAVLDPDLAGCPVVLLVDGEVADDSTIVQQDGRAVADTTIPENTSVDEADRRTSTVVLATVDGRTVALARFTVAPDRTTPGWILAIVLLLLAALVLAAVQAERARRQRAWVSEHVRTEPVMDVVRVHTTPVPDAAPTLAVRLRPRPHPGTIETTKEGDG